MSKVVPLRDRPAYASRVLGADEAMRNLRWEMHGWEPQDLAEAADVSKGTIYAIRSGRTKWPRPNTFFALLNVLDLEMYLVKK